MFKLIVKKEFSAAHILHGHPGDCKRMHGHNWLVEAEVRGSNTNEIGMVIDFKDIKNNLQDIIGKLDHQYLNDIEPFTNENPTAENISKYIYKELSKNINTDNIKVSEIKLWETSNSAVTYTE
ncbi:MAG: 6-carboxytetrahydropterin synthase QueD [Gammaproteobacteria bacterium]|jgi:6-pyruvoyltetrahydropterin/6-carboxytetrahydropterin synthase|nr:6-carboxytetrahydropterin synthase QueD [Gammaproteobacteria bacterium]